jgi:FeS assembly SUF system regulator
MLRMSRMADYGTVVMSFLARTPERQVQAGEIADAVHIALPTVSKILKMLARAHLLLSYRGAQGGYRLARSPEAISVSQIIDAMDGPIALTECDDSNGSGCCIESHCEIRGNWQRVSQVVRGALARLSLAELAQPQPQAIQFMPPRMNLASAIGMQERNG